jgi:hypothetical protein
MGDAGTPVSEDNRADQGRADRCRDDKALYPLVDAAARV